MQNPIIAHKVRNGIALDINETRQWHASGIQAHIEVCEARVKAGDKNEVGNLAALREKQLNLY